MEEMGERPLKMNILRKRMYDLGWPELTDFVRATRLQLSFETCRRAIYDDRQNIRYEYIVRIMQALEFTPEEIAEELKRRGDENLHKLVAESTEGTTLSSEEKMLIEELRAINNPGVYDVVMAVLTALRSGASNKEEPDRPAISVEHPIDGTS